MMKRVWRIKSDAAAAQSELSFLHRTNPTKKPLPNPTLLARTSAQRFYSSQSNQCPNNSFPNIVGLFADKWSYNPDSRAREDLCTKVSRLRDELLFNADSSDRIVRVLEGLGEPLFRGYSDGSAFVELLKQLRSSPSLALEVMFFTCCN